VRCWRRPRRRIDFARRAVARASRRRGAPVTALILAAFLSPAPAAESAREFLQRYLKETETLEAAFVQTLLDETGEVLEVAEGAMYLQRPGRFRWDYRAPYEQSIIGDGETVWIYDPDLDQVTRQPMDEALADTPAALLGNEIDLDRAFDVTLESEQDDFRWIDLAPKAKDQQFTAIRLAFDAEALARMELSDNFGQRTLIEFSEARRNQHVDPGLFDFTPPPGMDVIESSGGL
jgi:outer membrane lipoprotein carrier protein